MVIFRIVGAGRAGRSFKSALRHRGAKVEGPLRRNDPLDGVAKNADVVLLAVPDSAIDEVARQIDPGDAVVVHLSGATSLAALSPHQKRGSLHPLASLPNPVLGAERLLDQATFAVAGDSVVHDIVELLGGSAIEISEDQRALYHAAAAVASNHVVALCGQVHRLARLLNVDPTPFTTLMSTSLDNAIATEPRSALTGPASRGDHTTIDSHLAALPESEHELYTALARSASMLAGLAPYPKASPREPSGAPGAVTAEDG